MRAMRSELLAPRAGLWLWLVLLAGRALADASPSAPGAGTPAAAPAPVERKVWRAPDGMQARTFPDVKRWLASVAEENGWDVAPRVLAGAWKVERQVQAPKLGTFMLGRLRDVGSTQPPGDASWMLVRRSPAGLQVLGPLLMEMQPTKYYEGTVLAKALAFKSKLGATGQVLWVELEEAKTEQEDAHATRARKTRTRLGYAFAADRDGLVQVAANVPLHIVSSLEGKTDVDATLEVQFPAPGVMRVTRASGEPTPEQQEWLGEYDLAAGAAPPAEPGADGAQGG